MLALICQYFVSKIHLPRGLTAAGIPMVTSLMRSSGGRLPFLLFRRVHMVRIGSQGNGQDVRKYTDYRR